MRGVKHGAALLAACAVMIGSVVALDAATQAGAINPGDVRFVRSIAVKADKIEAAEDFAQRVATYINANYPETVVRVYVEVAGPNGTIQWYADFADLATFESVRNRLTKDPGYIALRDEGVAYFNASTCADSLQTTLN